MAVYKNNDEKAVLASMDFDDSNNTSFFIVKHEVDVDKAKALLTAVGQSILAQSYVNGHTIVISHGPDTKEKLIHKLAVADGGAFEPQTPKEQTFLKFLHKNGWKIRGGSSVVGQSMTLLSAFTSISTKDAEAGLRKAKFDPAIGAFATLNLAANFVNYIFGGQKEEDIKGLEKFDSIIADEVNRYLPEGTKKIVPDDVRKLSYMNDEEMAEHNKSRSAAGIMQKNSVRVGEVGLRTLGSLCMMFNYRKILPALKILSKGNFKEAFLTAKVTDPNTFLAGCGMVAGKAMSLSAQTYDPNNPPTTYIGELRQKVLWITSTFTEMVSQSFVAFDRKKNKRMVMGGKVYQDSLGVGGNILLTVPPYPTRIILPYGEKVLDVAEVQARLLDELPNIPQDKIPEVAARVTARMVEHMGEKSPSFSELYKNILHKLEKFHRVSVLPESEHIATEASHFAEKVGHKKPDIAKSNANSMPRPGAIRQLVDKDSVALSSAASAQLG